MPIPFKLYSKQCSSIDVVICDESWGITSQLIFRWHNFFNPDTTGN
jgi:hypothetical protein